ncbi:MAG: TIGR01777 family oxidoreductase [Gammaproteobacteria bacterium]|nr:TIGR01777 family oxidoreductase [Gammaproteobacteria bacterium]
MIPLSVWVIVSIQVVLGFLDVVVHHELVARLPWRAGAGPELRLHGIRNLAYAAIFLVLAWVVPLGWAALALVGFLAIEIVITFTDWFVEDATRRLPSTERALHGLLAINFGALLAFLAPVVWQWLQAPTSIQFADRGVWSWLASMASAGLLVMAVRDFAAARRTRQLQDRPLDPELVDRRRWLVTGATGFIGQRLTEALARGGQEVTVLTREVSKAGVLKPPFRVVTNLDQIGAGERFDVIVHLAGEPVAAGLWNESRRGRIMNSRPELARRLIDLVDRLDVKPRVWIGASAVGWYGDCGETTLDERAVARDGFTHRSCEAAETASMLAERRGMRVVMLRIGLVLGREGGLLAQLLAPFDLGLGGRLGSGRQWMSWIERDDLVRLIVHVVANESIRGPLNAVAPHPVTNREFTKALARTIRRPALLAIPQFVLLAAMGDMARELVLASQRVVSAKALEHGFEFRWPKIDAALARSLS